MSKQVIFLHGKQSEPTSIRSDIKDAVEGNWGGMSTYLYVLSEAIRQHVPLHPDDSEFLADSLRDISEGSDPKAALSIRRKRGEKDLRRSVSTAIRLAIEIAILRKKEKRLTIEKAICKIHEKENVSEETIWKAWKAHRKYIRLRRFGAIYRPPQTVE